MVKISKGLLIISKSYNIEYDKKALSLNLKFLD